MCPKRAPISYEQFIFIQIIDLPHLKFENDVPFLLEKFSENLASE